MSEQLRLQILSIFRDIHDSASGEIREDVDLGQELGENVAQMQTQLDILEDQGLVSVDKSFGPSCGAVITPRGLLYLEHIEEHIKRQKPKGPLGFRAPRGE